MSKSQPMGITETLEQNFMPYAMSVILSRAIPEIDGFKPSHRKLLYTMYKMKLLTGARTKSANVVGQTMKLNPHGDQAIYATLVRLTRGHDALIHPYIDSKGNFGKTTSRDMAFAAARYTECKLDKISSELFKDIDKNTVDFVDNYDGQMQEPLLLPTTFPNILVNANKGIAVGMASNFCSFNLKEVCDATIAYMKNPEVDMLKYLKAPDMSTGGQLLYNRSKLSKIYDTGVGSFKIRAKYEYVKKDNCIEITEIPYTATVEQIIDKIIDMVKSGKVREINDIRDETDLSGLKIAIDLKRGIDADKLMAKLYRFTPLEDSFSCNFNLLVEGMPQVLGIKGILKAWLEFRIACIKRQLAFDIDKLDQRLHLLRGLEKVILDIDKAIAIIRETEEEKLVVPNLMDYFKIDEIQAEYVADIKLRNINKEYILKRTSEISSLEDERAALLDMLSDESKIKGRIKDELKKISKTYGKPRKTRIIDPDDALHHDDEKMIPDYNLKVFFTDHNYFKKVSLASLRAGSNHKLKDDDFIVQEIEGSNKDEMLFFSNKHNVYKVKLHEIADHKASSLGVYLPNILELEEGELIQYVVLANDFEGHMVYVFDNGKVAKVPLKSYETKTNRKKLVKAYSDFGKLVRMFYIREEMKCVLIRYSSPDEYRLITMPTDLIPEKATKNTRGVQAVRMKKGSKVLKCYMMDELEIEDLDRFLISKVPMSGKEVDMIERSYLLELVDHK